MKKFVPIGNLQSYGTAMMLSAITMGWKNNIFSLFKNVLKISIQPFLIQNFLLKVRFT